MTESTEHTEKKAKHVHRLLLVAGPWRSWFAEDRYKLIIAMALNDCVVHERHEHHEQHGRHEWGKFFITGYLITCCRLYLVCKTSRKEWQHVLDYFFHRVQHYIEKEWRRKEEDPCWYHTVEQRPVLPLQHFNPFHVYPLNEGWVVLLITGQKVNPGYDDPKLHRLEQWLHRQRFCSLINYEGGCGPVKVKTGRKDDDCEDNEEDDELSKNKF
jgi:hypothetical protein